MEPVDQGLQQENPEKTLIVLNREELSNYGQTVKLHDNAY